jgi:hypothetical protein
MHCAACNRELTLAPGERLGFREACEGCDADLHSCVNCAHYDPGAHNDCREPSAEYVSDRERANRCDWFQPGDREGGEASPRDQALSDLDALFKK